MSDSPSKPLVLVTGASGFIAGHCVNELMENGYSVRGTVRSLKNEKKVAHLRELAAKHGTEIDLVEADLSSDLGWSEAVDGCTYVLHVASPFPSEQPDDENDLIRPAVDGARRVLEACAATKGAVQRVVLTSSVAAVSYGSTPSNGKAFTEEDWSTIDKCDAYPKSKTLAEREAWKIVEGLPDDEKFELAVINPGFVAGPLLSPNCGTSGEVLRRLMSRGLPACPELGWALVDVRDVALAHRLAMETPKAAGNRYIAAGAHMWMQELGKILAEEFNPKGFKVPTGKLPYWVLWIGARFDKTLKLALAFIGHREDISAEKANTELGWTPRPARDTVIDMGYSLIEHGIVAEP